MSFQIIRDDITHVKADAIVNTANPKPVYGGGVDSAIYQAAGAEALLAERKKIGCIAPGQAAATPAFGLDARYILHTVGPLWVDGLHGEEQILGSCYRSCLTLALQLGCRSVAFPLIAAGVYGFPRDKALQIAMGVIQPFLMEHDMTVTLVVFSEDAFRLSGKVVDNVRAYVDAHYVAQASAREYGMDHQRERRLYAASVPPAGFADIDSMLAASEKTFQEKLFEIIDSRGLTGPQVYKNYISKQVFSKIQADRNYHPNKYTAIALCLSLHLDVAQTQDLIGRAGWTLSPSSKSDLVVKACILNREFNVVNIDLLLFDHHCPRLENIK